MSIIETEKAVRRHLLTLSPQLPTALEAIPFDPTPSGMYQRLQFLVNPPTDPVLGRGYHRENIQVQIFIVDELDIGTSGAISRAQDIRDLFHKGLTLNESGISMYVLKTPQITGATVASDRVIVPVLIPLVVDVFE